MIAALLFALGLSLCATVIVCAWFEAGNRADGTNRRDVPRATETTGAQQRLNAITTSPLHCARKRARANSVRAARGAVVPLQVLR